MANYQNLKAAISAAIRTNGNQEITGQVLQDVLNSIVSVIGANYTFAGVATPATNPGTPDQNVMYLAMEGGTYTNFNGTVLPAGISLLMWNGSWTSETVMYGDGGVFDISVYKSSGGTLATFADLAAALNGGNNIPVCVRKGLSVKFVQSSDNNYRHFTYLLQYENTTAGNAAFLNPANWQGIDEKPSAESKNLVKSGGIYEAIQTNKKTLKIELVDSVDDDEEIEIVSSNNNTLVKINDNYADFKNLKSNGKDVAQKEYVDAELENKQDKLKDVNETSILDNTDSIEFRTDNDSKIGEIQVKETTNTEESVEITDNSGQISFAKMSSKGIQSKDFFNANGFSLTELTKYGVYSKIFKTIKPAWADVDNNYESWPFGGLFIQNNKLKLIYNSSDAHIDRYNSNVMMREKEVLGEWFPKRTVITHTPTYSYQNPSCCILNNGDIFTIVQEKNATDYPNVDVGYYVKLRSTDGGVTWTNEGRVKVNGTDVVEEGMIAVFCTSNDYILSFVGGIYGGKYIASTDNGLTWNYIGDDFGIGTEDASFLEMTDGSIISILRKNGNYPALISISSDLSTVTTLYDFGSFNFKTYWNPTSITKLNDGKILLLGCNRVSDTANGTYGTIMEAIVSEQDIIDNNINSSIIARFQAPRLNDFGYITAVEFPDGIVYAYFYGGEIAGTAKIWEMVGNY